MKKIIQYIFLLSVVSIGLISCKQTIVDRTKELAPLSPTQLDVNAGDWKPVILTAANEFALTAPLAITNGAYLRELNEIKQYQLSLTDAQKASIRYWGAGAVLRWNEIMRELVAKRNLPPYQNADGTYPTPSAANPFNYPEFPFLIHLMQQEHTPM